MDPVDTAIHLRNKLITPFNNPLKVGITRRAVHLIRRPATAVRCQTQAVVLKHSEHPAVFSVVGGAGEVVRPLSLRGMAQDLRLDRFRVLLHRAQHLSGGKVLEGKAVPAKPTVPVTKPA